MAVIGCRAALLFLAFIVASVGQGCSSGGGGDGGGDDQFVEPADDTGPAQGATQRIDFCSTEDPDNETMGQLEASFASFLADNSSARGTRLARGEISIPVIFHVISAGSTFDEGEVPDALLYEQIAVLNRAYSGETGGIATAFRFSLLGINRVRNAAWHVMSPGSATEIDAKRSLKSGGADTLNVYLVHIEGPGGHGQILGYSTLPVFYRLLEPLDGVVVNFRAVPGGPLEHYSTGHVLVHEAGHWLGLLHTFQGECDGFFTDLIPDTPRERIPGQGDFCPAARDSCPAQEGEDPVHNHMTYTVDTRRTEFTENQVQFMQFNSILFRQILVF